MTWLVVLSVSKHSWDGKLEANQITFAKTYLDVTSREKSPILSINRRNCRLGAFVRKDVAYRSVRPPRTKKQSITHLPSPRLVLRMYVYRYRSQSAL